MAALWLGAQNIEQTKYLNWEDLQLALGLVRYPTAQRDRLKELAADPLEGHPCLPGRKLKFRLGNARRWK